MLAQRPTVPSQLNSMNRPLSIELHEPICIMKILLEQTREEIVLADAPVRRKARIMSADVRIRPAGGAHSPEPRP